jgi:hypothetical protein
MGGCGGGGSDRRTCTAGPIARADDSAISATPRPAATSSRMLAGLWVSSWMRGVKPAAAAAASAAPLPDTVGPMEIAGGPQRAAGVDE